MSDEKEGRQLSQAEWLEQERERRKIRWVGKFGEARCECWKCHKVTRVYTWEGHGLWAETCPEEGRPATLRFRTTSVVSDRGYWLNTCEHCGMIQGDFYLFAEPDGVFFPSD